MKNLLTNPYSNSNLSNLKSLSNLDNQLELSLAIAGYFDIKDIEEMMNTVIQNNINVKRDLNQEEICIYKFTTGNNHELIINDILLLNHSPSVRFIEVIFKSDSTNELARIKYHYNKDMYGVICKIMSEAVNYKIYCTPFIEDITQIERKHLYVNYAQAAVRLMKDNYKYLMDFKYIMYMLINPRLFESRAKFFKTYNITSYIHIELVTITSDLVKFSIYNSNKCRYIYLYRNKKGMATLKLILELILRHRRYPYY